MAKSNQDLSFLDDVLVLAVHKSFWAAEECEVFPHRLYTRRIMPGPGKWGTSRNPLNVLNVAVGGYLYYLIHRPKLILPWAPRLSNWYVALKKMGLLPGTKLVAPGASRLSDDQAEYVHRLVVFSRGEIALHDPALRHKYEFIPLPADGPYDEIRPSQDGDYIFTGGGAGRDFATLIEAMRGVDAQLKIVTFSPETLGYDGELPDNCEVHWRMPVRSFLEMMSDALFVVVPLHEGRHPHGHTTVVQALRMGKAVVTTRNASVSDYVTHNRAGLLVSPGDVVEYRSAIRQLLSQPELRRSFEAHALARAPDLTYKAYARRLIEVCRRALKADGDE